MKEGVGDACGWRDETMNKNDWLVTWTAGNFEQKQECQYVSDLINLLQKEVICLENLTKIVIEPINREVQ